MTSRLPPTASNRDTRQKRAVRRALESTGRPLSTEEIHELASRESEGIGIATVYRSVRALVEQGFLSEVELAGRPTLYEIAGKAHHHHFVCEECGAVHELEGCSSSVKLTLPRGFHAREHQITVYGRCSACSRGPRGSSAR
jgi:Fur family ferric uptake transcriptional regulator